MKLHYFLILLVIIFEILHCESNDVSSLGFQETELKARRSKEIFTQKVVNKMKLRNCETWKFNEQERLLEQLPLLDPSRIDRMRLCEDLDNIPVFYYAFLNSRLLRYVDGIVQKIYQDQDDPSDAILKYVDPRTLVQIWDRLVDLPDMEPYFAEKYQWDDLQESRARTIRSLIDKLIRINFN